MKALVKTRPGVGNIELMEVKKPVPKQNEVLIKVKFCGICGTDIKIYDDEFYADTPVIIGHEFSGVVEAIGEKVSEIKTGDKVACEQHTNACYVCKYCLTGRRHLCAEKRSPGYLSDGAFAEYICMHESLVHIIPDKMSLKEAAVLEPMAIVAHALFEKTGIPIGDNAVILGCGPIALLALQILKACGAGKVYMTGIDADEDYRFEKALEYGADGVLNVLKIDAVKKIMELTGIGADLVLDLSGAPQAINQGMDMLCKDGKFCAIGLPHDKVSMDWSKAVLKAIQIFFSYSSSYQTWKKCINLIEKGDVILDDFTKEVFSLGDWEEGFKKAREGSALKVIIEIP